MTNVEYRKTLYEMSEILKILDIELVQKIPESIIDIIEKDKDITHEFKLDYTKKLEEQKLLETTEMFLTMLCLKFWCNEEQKKELLAKIVSNEKEYQAYLEKEFDVDAIFKSAKKDDKMENTNKKKVEEVQISSVKSESIFGKIISKIKRFFKK